MLRLPAFRLLTIASAFLVTASSVFAQAAPPGPLPPEPRISTISQLGREVDALANSQEMVARLLIRFDGGDVTTSLLKSNPYGFRLNAVSGGAKWKGIARNEKPKRLEANAGEAVVSADWTISNESRRARCVKENLDDGFYQVLFLRRTDTTDRERDGFICSFEPLPLPEEDLTSWIESIDGETVPTFNSCADASGNEADEAFWQCLTDNEVGLPPLTLEMAQRMKS